MGFHGEPASTTGCRNDRTRSRRLSTAVPTDLVAYLAAQFPLDHTGCLLCSKHPTRLLENSGPRKGNFPQSDQLIPMRLYNWPSKLLSCPAEKSEQHCRASWLVLNGSCRKQELEVSTFTAFVSDTTKECLKRMLK
jgi:hypothetical protein